MRWSHDTYAQAFATAYAALVTNLLLVAMCSPLLVVVLGAPAAPAPGAVLFGPLLAPALCAAFTVFATLSADPTAPVARTFMAAWRRCWRPALTLGAATVAVLAVLAVDVRVVWARPVGALAIPVFVSLAVTVLATAVLSLVILAERPGARLRVALGAAAHFAVRRWYLTGFSLAVLSLLATVVMASPVVGLGIAAAPLLYVVWANSRHSLRAALDGSPAPEP